VYQPRPGVVTLMLHEKTRRDQRQVDVPSEIVELLEAYISAFNAEAERCGQEVRIGVGVAGPLWRNGYRGAWGEANVRRRLREACQRAHVPLLRPHDLRRWHVNAATRSVTRETTARGGGWLGTRILDRHYLSPNAESVWERLDRLPAPASASSPVGADERQRGSAASSTGGQR
jgi:hypothetical protein